MLPASVKDSDFSSTLPEQTCQRFTLAEIQSATHNFDVAFVVGRGGFGNVYKSSSKNCSLNEVAIKRLNSMSNQGAHEFEAEVGVLSKLRHCNLVSLIGYCNEGQEMVLVYEFMPNGTLDDHLHKADTALSWLQRLEICIGAARGLDYLHTGTATQHGVIHRDVKTSNILLDANFAAKVSDFGLAKVCPANQTRTHVSTRVKGTFGYMDPFYFFSGKLTRKSDVYAFGVVLFEVLSGRQAVDPTLDEEQWSLAAWAQDQIKKGKLNQIIDSRLMGQISKKCLKEFASIADRCLHNQPKQRPTMAEVVVKLESILSQERESVDSVVDEGTFINKVRSFFTAKADLMPARALGSKSEIIVDHIEKSGNQSLRTLAQAVGSKSESSAHHIEISSNQSLRTFAYAELARATNNFKNEEHSRTLLATIYKGWVDERTYVPTECGVGLAIYVRKKDLRPSEMVEFNQDLKLEEFNHPNLVKLLGYCLNKHELFCVYELIPGPSLDRHLFGEPGTTSLSWAARLKIAVGAAEGLSFLHRRKQVAYNQFKTSVILLDTDFNARLWDFEMDESFLVQDSYLFHNDSFYAAPEWFSYQVAKLDGCIQFSLAQYGIGVESEIYSFGVVLLEILTGQKVYDVNRPQGKQNLVKWATPLLADEVNLVMIMDPQLQHHNNPPKGALKFALLVSNCLLPIKETRPSMKNILQVLYDCYKEETKSV